MREFEKIRLIIKKYLEKCDKISSHIQIVKQARLKYIQMNESKGFSTFFSSSKKFQEEDPFLVVFENILPKKEKT